MTLAILCSGQGGQHADMFALTGQEPTAAALFAQAKTLLGEDARVWVCEADSHALHQNREAQLLCTLQSLAAAAALADALPQQRCVAGYSVGEVAAWSVAGIILPTNALDLVMLRAQAMDNARVGDQGMLFVRGLERSLIEALIAKENVHVAIANPGDAFVLAGLQSALAIIAPTLLQHGATRVVPVPVSVASHTVLMADAAPIFRASLLRRTMVRALPTGVRLISGVDGAAVMDIVNGVDKLARQIAHTVEWSSCLQACMEAGATAFLELGPGRALAEMAAAAYPNIPARSLDEFRSIAGIKAWLARLI